MGVIDWLAAKVSRANMYLHRRKAVDIRRNLAYDLVWQRAAQQSADFIEASLAEAVLHPNRLVFWKHVLREIPSEGQLIEVGVFQGASVNMIADDRQRRGDGRLIHGFDSFEGLEEDWTGESLPQGFFNQQGRLPDVRPNVRLHKGWVQETQAAFLAASDDSRIALLHIDTDTYMPAHHTLTAAKPFLVTGSIIVFDELIGYPNWQAHEYKALTECLEPSSYRFFAFTSRQAALRII
jgi:hypothetical protein